MLGFVELHLYIIWKIYLLNCDTNLWAIEYVLGYISKSIYHVTQVCFFEFWKLVQTEYTYSTVKKCICMILLTSSDCKSIWCVISLEPDSFMVEESEIKE